MVIFVPGFRTPLSAFIHTHRQVLALEGGREEASCITSFLMHAFYYFYCNCIYYQTTVLLPSLLYFLIVLIALYNTVYLPNLQPWILQYKYEQLNKYKQIKCFYSYQFNHKERRKKNKRIIHNSYYSSHGVLWFVVCVSVCFGHQLKTRETNPLPGDQDFSAHVLINSASRKEEVDEHESHEMKDQNLHFIMKGDFNIYEGIYTMEATSM